MTDIEQRKKAARLTIANVLAGTGAIIGAEVMDTLWELTEPAPSEWQTIDSAPRDGTKILIRGLTGKIHLVKWKNDDDEELSWWKELGTLNIIYPEGATHWTLIPCIPMEEQKHE